MIFFHFSLFFTGKPTCLAHERDNIYIYIYIYIYMYICIYICIYIYTPLNKMSIYLGIVAKAWNSRLWARGAADLCGPGCHQKGLSTELLTFCVLPSDTSGPPRAIVNFELQKRRPKNVIILSATKTRKNLKMYAQRLPEWLQNRPKSGPGIVFSEF